MILPGDVAQSILGQSATPQALANLREELGINEPPLARYINWLWSALHGDLGTALTNGKDIATSLSKRLGNTLFLAFWTAVISVPLAILLGLLAACYKDHWPDKLISAVTLTSISIPEFLISYVLIYVVSVKLRWLPTLVVLAQMMRMTRAAILNVIQSAYIKTAELKGLPAIKIIWRHALPNSISPIVNIVMLNLAYLVVGVVVIEVVFVYPGLGQYLVDHVSKRDVPVVQACGLMFAAVYIGFNLIADLVSILSNPRLRHPK